MRARASILVIEVTSAPGAGTRFRVHLPALVGLAAEDADRGAPPVVRGTGAVLVVEDDPRLRDVMAMMLEALGYNAKVASSPQEALVWCLDAGRHFDLLLTDVIMPGMSGLDLVERVKAVRPDLKVLLVSGYPPESVTPPGALGTGRDYLQKPFSTSDLSLKVADTLGRSRG